MGTNANASENGSRASSSKSGSRNGAFYAIGGIIVAGTLCLSVLGSQAAIAYMQNQSDGQLKQAQQSVLDQKESEWQERLDEAEETNEQLQSELDDYQTKYAYTTDQLDWAHEKHIEWDEDGFPVNERGIVVDDPTTKTDEVERYDEFLVAQAEPVEVPETESEKPEEDSDKVSETEVEEPETETEEPQWWDEMDFIEVDEDGNPYYVVKQGDTLWSIAYKTGFSVSDLAKYNDLHDPTIINPGQIIKFPATGQFVVDGATGSGKG